MRSALPKSSLALVLAVGCGGSIPLVSPTVGQITYSADPPIGQCIASCARPGSIIMPRICHATCKDELGHLVYLSPSTPGLGAVLQNMAGPFSDIIGRLAPVVPIVP